MGAEYSGKSIGFSFQPIQPGYCIYISRTQLQLKKETDLITKPKL